MDILEYVDEHALTLIPVLYIVGMYIKSAPYIKDWAIPWIILFLGVIGSIALTGFTADSVIQGVLVSGVPVLGNQLYKQTTNKT